MNTQHEVTVPLRGNHALHLYEIKEDNDAYVGICSAVPSAVFVPTDYSEFKYGRLDMVEYYSQLLAILLRPHLEAAEAANEQIVVMGTPIKRLPNAARMLAINTERLLRDTGLPTSYVTIYQHRLAEGDYSRLSAVERDKRNGNKQRFFDPSDFVGRHVVVIDDIRITGSIERSIAAILEGVGILSLTIVNLVMLDPSVALAKPHLEHELNHKAMRNLDDLFGLMEDNGNFRLTTRAVRFILESDLDEVSLLLMRLQYMPDLLTALYEGIVDDGYDQMAAYAATVQLVFKARKRLS